MSYVLKWIVFSLPNKSAIACNFYFVFSGCSEVYKNSVRARACTWGRLQRERFTSIQSLEKIMYFSFISLLTVPFYFFILFCFNFFFFFIHKLLFYHIFKTTPMILWAYTKFCLIVQKWNVKKVQAINA